MKSILMSIKPKWVMKILNEEKTIEIRKKFPKDYVGWVYIYCTKDKKYANLINRGGFLTGMVVGRFWCDKVEHIEYETCSRDISGWWKDDGKMFNHKDACLTYEEMFDYIGSGEGYAIHITKLEIFDKPKAISEFYNYCKDEKCEYRNNHCSICRRESLNRAPQSWCYIENI